MTSNAVTGYNILMQGSAMMPPQASNKGYPQKDFTQMMNSANDNQNVKSEKSLPQDKKVEDVSYEQEKGDNVIEEEISKLTKEETSKVDDSKKEEVDQKLEELKGKIAKILNIDVSELSNLMEELNLEIEDLIDLESLTLLLANYYQQPDALCIVVDESIYGDFKEVVASAMNTSEEIANLLGVDQADLKGLLEQLKNETNLETSIQTNDNVDFEEKLTMANNSEEQTVSKDQQIGENLKENLTVSEGNEQTPENGGMQQETASSGKQGEEREDGKQTPLVGVISNLEDKLNAILKDNSQISQANLSTQENIVRQLVEQIKVNINPNITEMELQLHPASLGSVNVQVAFKNGELTAQFTAQNEMTKEAIESQIVQLKESLQEQGIKVEAIEVTIASHEFERNLQQDSSNQEEKSERKKTRKISLNTDEDIDFEELAEDEQIAVEMMRENGNTVDYTA